VITGAGAVFAAVPSPNGDGVAQLLAALVAIFLATKLLGELAQRLGQPSVLGELVAGVLLGGSLLGIVDPNDPVIHAMATIGVVVLLFETGIHTELKELLQVGAVAGVVAITGVVLPMGLGYGVATALGVSTIPALVCGAALCATSVGISARVLSDLRVLETNEGRVVLGAAVIDDIIGLIILSMVAAIVAGGAVSVGKLSLSALVAIAFVVVSIAVGTRVAPPVFRFVERVKTGGTLGMIALAFAFLMAWLADLAGSALIVGAFAAGVVLDDSDARREISRATTTIGHFFVPIFFASVGAAVNLRALADGRSLAVGGLLIVAGVIGKVAAGYAPYWFKGNKLLVGAAMMPRGEVGLIFAQMGLQSGAIDDGLFGAIMLMVLVTTLVTPPALSRIVRRTEAWDAAETTELAERPGDGGIDDLVAGTSSSDLARRTPRSTTAFKRRSDP
jgi:Kef-type K+ transport system membrane component KefB